MRLREFLKELSRRRARRPAPLPGQLGMTLIEIMVVVSIIGLLMGTVGVVAYNRYKKAKVSNAKMIIKNVQDTCEKEGIREPDIFTEFGRYTVGESGAIIFEVLEQKQQNDTETWYIVNNSLMNTIPDAWSIHEKFILLPVNKWYNEFGRVNIGGIHR